MTDGKLDERRARRVVQGIIQSKRRGYLTVMGEFKHLVKLQQVRQTAKIESAAPLPPELLARVRASVEKTYGAEIATSFGEDSDLIGGLRIQVGSDVYDGSVQSRLAVLKTRFGITAERKPAHQI